MRTVYRWGAARLVVGCSALALAMPRCVKVVEFEEEQTFAYLFVDGAVEVGTASQEILVGRTDGAGRDGSEPIPGVAVRLIDLTAGIEVACDSREGGAFACALPGRLDRAYRLEIDIPAEGTYAAESGPLAPAELNPAYESGLVVRRRPDGSEVEVPVAFADVLYDVPDEVDWTLLTRPSFSWAYTDRATGGFDIARTCYYDEGPLEGYSVVDVAGQAPGSRARVRAANIPLDFRTGGASVVAIEVMRVPSAARRYYRDLAVASNLEGSIFSERPYTTTGNLVGPEEAPAMLGYFAVREVQEGSLLLNTNEIRRQTPPPVCAQFNNTFPPGIDCVECLNTNVELYGVPSQERPAWWP